MLNVSVTKLTGKVERNEVQKTELAEKMIKTTQAYERGVQGNANETGRLWSTCRILDLHSVA